MTAPAIPPADPSIMRRWGVAGVTACLLLVAAAYFCTRHWPLAGDAVLIRYTVFLTHHGFAPYRNISEINLPMAYMVEDAAMRIFGDGAEGLRLYDAALSCALLAGSWLLLRRLGLTAILMATLFVAIHLQDGVIMAGQRDLAVAVFQLLSLAATIHILRTHESAGFLPAEVVAAFAAGACASIAACIKPPAALLPLLVLFWISRQSLPAKEMLRAVTFYIIGLAVPLAACLLYLWRFHAVTAFWQTLRGLIAYHATLEHRPAAFLLTHIFSPISALPVFVLLVVALRRGMEWTPQETLLTLGMVAGAVSYFVQGKGFPYQRYPFLLFLLLLCGALLHAAWKTRQDTRSSIRYAAVQFLLFVVCVLFVVRSTHYSITDPYGSLETDLRPILRTGGSVQCMDTPGECLGALYAYRRVQATGFLYDCYFADNTKPVVQQLRQEFQRQFEANPPDAVVMTDSVCFGQTRSFDKYREWPWLTQELATHYRISVERTNQAPIRLWSRAVIPPHYILWQRRDVPLP